MRQGFETPVLSFVSFERKRLPFSSSIGELKLWFDWVWSTRYFLSIIEEQYWITMIGFRVWCDVSTCRLPVGYTEKCKFPMMLCLFKTLLGRVQEKWWTKSEKWLEWKRNGVLDLSTFDFIFFSFCDPLPFLQNIALLNMWSNDLLHLNNQNWLLTHIGQE